MFIKAFVAENAFIKALGKYRYLLYYKINVSGIRNYYKINQKMFFKLTFKSFFIIRSKVCFTKYETYKCENFSF